MNKTLKWFIALATMFLSNMAIAVDEETVCVKYKKEYGWSQGYEVDAKVISGSELMAATGNYSRFRSYTTYAVIFWGKEQATILEMPASSMGSIPMFKSTVKDMDGRDWQIEQSSGFCF
nr:hypothetical protein [Pseudomonas toyotomiensis]